MRSSTHPASKEHLSGVSYYKCQCDIAQSRWNRSTHLLFIIYLRSTQHLCLLYYTCSRIKVHTQKKQEQCFTDLSVLTSPACKVPCQWYDK